MTDRKGRGFAGMDRAKQREIASKGGRAAHEKGTAHRFTPEEARLAGRKGGQAAHVKGTAHEFTPEEARLAGRKGGQAARTRLSSRNTPLNSQAQTKRGNQADEGMNGGPAQPNTAPITSSAPAGNGLATNPPENRPDVPDQFPVQAVPAPGAENR